MRNKLLVITLFVISTALLASSNGKNRRILKKIEMKECSSCSYNIIYENSDIRLFFDKSLFVKYINSSEYKNQDKTRELIDFISSSPDTLNFHNPYWAMNTYPKKYGVTDETTMGYGYENSPADIIQKNKDLKNSEIFENIIMEYLKEGEFKIFEKKQKTFIFPKTINLIWWHKHSGDKYSTMDVEGNSYELTNGTKIIDKILKMSIGDNFDFIKKK